MSWKRFCELGNVPIWYQNVTKSNIKIPTGTNGISFKQMAENFISSPSNIILLGAPGTGKTHFSYCLMRGLLDRNPNILGELRFFKSKTLDDNLLSHTKKYGESKFFLDSLKEFEYLFIDDIGTEKDTDRSKLDYYELLDDRLYNMKKTILSTNLNETELCKYLGERVYSRLKHYVWIDFEGPDLRGRIKL